MSQITKKIGKWLSDGEGNLTFVETVETTHDVDAEIAGKEEQLLSVYEEIEALKAIKESAE